VTGSTAAGIFAAVILLANPNLQYLQSCPLTEPLYMVLQLAAMDALLAWRQRRTQDLPWAAAAWMAASALCRYEGWYFLAGAFLLLIYDWRTGTLRLRHMLRAGLTFAVCFAVPVGAHFGYIYLRIGDTFVNRVISGNPAPYVTFKRPLLSATYHLAELVQIATIVPLILAAAGAVQWLRRRDRRADWAPLLLLWTPSLINISALYWGLIYRVRYSILLLPAVAVFAGLATGNRGRERRLLIIGGIVAMALPWVSWLGPDDWSWHELFAGPGIYFLPAFALLLVMYAFSAGKYRWALAALCAAAMQAPVLEGEHRVMLTETLEHEFIEPERDRLLDYLRRHYDGSRILLDMGRQAPLVYDSRLPIREFVFNEGSLELWRKTARSPEREVGWLCAEKGDAVWRLTRREGWAAAYSLAVQTENLLLYRLTPDNRRALLKGQNIE
jgi:hypothetical protein